MSVQCLLQQQTTLHLQSKLGSGTWDPHTKWDPQLGGCKGRGVQGHADFCSEGLSQCLSEPWGRGAG